jgi:hypothetical protein
MEPRRRAHEFNDSVSDRAIFGPSVGNHGRMILSGAVEGAGQATRGLNDGGQRRDCLILQLWRIKLCSADTQWDIALK